MRSGRGRFTYSRRVEQTADTDNDLTTDDDANTSGDASNANSSVVSYSSRGSGSARSLQERRPIAGTISRDMYYVLERDLSDGKWKHFCRVTDCEASYAWNSGTGGRLPHAAEHKRLNQRPPPITEENRIDLLVRLVTKLALPFTIVEDKDFRHLTGVVMCRKNLRDTIVARAERMKQQIREELNACDSVSLTTDIWFNSGKSYACYTAHFIRDGTFHSALIDFINIPAPHTGLFLTTLTQGVLDQYQISTKCVAITSDGATNNGLSMAHLNNLRQADDLLPIKRIYCVCHIIHNCVIRAITKTTGPFKALMAKAQRLCKKIKRSLELGQFLAESCDAVQQKRLVVKLEVSTRWNTLFAQVKRLLKLKAALNHLFSHETRRSQFTDEERLTESDWQSLQALHDILLPIHDAAVLLSSSDKANFSNTLVLYMVALDHLGQDLYASNQFATSLKAEMMKEKEKVFCEEAELATALDPNWRLERFTATDATRVLTRLREILNQQASAPDSSQTSASTSSAGSSVWQMARRMDNSMSSSVDEVSQYMQLPNEMEDQDGRPVDVLKWWKDRQQRFPNLFKLAMRYNSIQPSSVASECAFSQAGDLVTVRRNRLGGDVSSSCMVLHHAFKHGKQLRADDSDAESDEEDAWSQSQ